MCPSKFLSSMDNYPDERLLSPPELFSIIERTCVYLTKVKIKTRLLPHTTTTSFCLSQSTYIQTCIYISKGRTVLCFPVILLIVLYYCRSSYRNLIRLPFWHHTLLVIHFLCPDTTICM